jgi:hypothetical protein
VLQVNKKIWALYPYFPNILRTRINATSQTPFLHVRALKSIAKVYLTYPQTHTVHIAGGNLARLWFVHHTIHHHHHLHLHHRHHQGLNFSICLAFFKFRGVRSDWVHLVRRPLTGLLYQPRMIDEDGAIGGMKIGRGNRSAQRKPAPVSLWPPQIPHDLTLDRTRATAMRSRRLTAWAMPRPLL